MDRAASPVHKHGGRVGTCALQVSHGVPLVDAALLRGDAALVEGHPRESDAPWEVVEAAGYLACLVEDLQGRPVEARGVQGLLSCNSHWWPAGGKEANEKLSLSS